MSRPRTTRHLPGRLRNQRGEHHDRHHPGTSRSTSCSSSRTSRPGRPSPTRSDRSPTTRTTPSGRPWRSGAAGSSAARARAHLPWQILRNDAGVTRRTDGPYAESVEQLGGFYIVESPSMEAIVESAEEMMPVHVRLEIAAEPPGWGRRWPGSRDQLDRVADRVDRRGEDRTELGAGGGAVVEVPVAVLGRPLAVVAQVLSASLAAPSGRPRRRPTGSCAPTALAASGPSPVGGDRSLARGRVGVTEPDGHHR